MFAPNPVLILLSVLFYLLILAGAIVIAGVVLNRLYGFSDRTLARRLDGIDARLDRLERLLGETPRE